MTTPPGTREKSSPAPREGQHALVAGAEGPDVSEALTSALKPAGCQVEAARQGGPGGAGPDPHPAGLRLLARLPECVVADSSLGLTRIESARVSAGCDLRHVRFLSGKRPKAVS
ncbi:hypothetical protein [Streptomyces yerevanensis]|uniref:hypothetical protein n=1 Tax=Streptomyces yerevanensis TaxID=66378 RepID=UPI0012FE91F0|nr:hypothetical protein [Streptomyces yerevanensis]